MKIRILPFHHSWKLCAASVFMVSGIAGLWSAFHSESRQTPLHEILALNPAYVPGGAKRVVVSRADTSLFGQARLEFTNFCTRTVELMGDPMWPYAYLALIEPRPHEYEFSFKGAMHSDFGVRTGDDIIIVGSPMIMVFTHY